MNALLYFRRNITRFLRNKKKYSIVYLFLEPIVHRVSSKRVHSVFENSSCRSSFLKPHSHEVPRKLPKFLAQAQNRIDQLDMGRIGTSLDTTMPVKFLSHTFCAPPRVVGSIVEGTRARELYPRVLSKFGRENARTNRLDKCPASLYFFARKGALS